MTRTNEGLALSYVKLLLSSWKTFEGMAYKQMVGIPMGGRDFISNLHKSKRFHLIVMLNDTSRYIDDILTIANIELKNIPVFLIYGQQTFSLTKQILKIKKLFPRI